MRKRRRIDDSRISKYKYIIINLLLIMFIVTLYFMRFGSGSKNDKIDMSNEDNIALKVKNKDSFYIPLSDIFGINVSRFYKFNSSNKRVVKVNHNGEIESVSPGVSTVTASFLGNKLKTKVTSYDVQDILIIVGDSRMVHLSLDNDFSKTDRDAVTYTTNKKLLYGYSKVYIVAINGRRYDWFAGLGEYESDNAISYVKDIISEYAEKTSDIHKYNIKLLFNLGVNDMAKYNLEDKDESPSEVARDYVKKINSVMDNEWKNEKINNISLNMVTLFPVQDEQLKCYYKERSNKSVKEFNNVIKKEYKNTVCDAFNDISFNDDVFREREGDNTCSLRDGLHFDAKFNKDTIYPYLVSKCSKRS